MKHLLLGIFVVMVMVSGVAQEAHVEATSNARKPLKDRLFFTGGGGAQFGAVTAVDVTPGIGYKFNDRVSAGVGFQYQYINFKSYTVNNLVRPGYSTHVFGPQGFGRVQILDFIFGYTEYQYLTLKYRDASFTPDQPSVSRSVPVMFVGGGYNTPLGKGASFGLSVLWDVIKDPSSPYQQNPVIRAGVGIGL